MTSPTVSTPSVTVPTTEVRARKAGVVADVISVAGRAVRSIPREPESVIPALIVPLFFFVVNTGSLTNLTSQLGPDFSFKAFQLPVAIIFAVTGISRASTLVTDAPGRSTRACRSCRSTARSARSDSGPATSTTRPKTDWFSTTPACQSGPTARAPAPCPAAHSAAGSPALLGFG